MPVQRVAELCGAKMSERASERRARLFLVGRAVRWRAGADVRLGGKAQRVHNAEHLDVLARACERVAGATQWEAQAERRVHRAEEGRLLRLGLTRVEQEHLDVATCTGRHLGFQRAPCPVVRNGGEHDQVQLREMQRDRSPKRRVGAQHNHRLRTRAVGCQRTAHRPAAVLHSGADLAQTRQVAEAVREHESRDDRSGARCANKQLARVALQPAATQLHAGRWRWRRRRRWRDGSEHAPARGCRTHAVRYTLPDTLHALADLAKRGEQRRWEWRTVLVQLIKYVAGVDAHGIQRMRVRVLDVLRHALAKHIAQVVQVCHSRASRRSVPT